MNWECYKAGFFLGLGATGGVCSLLFIATLISGFVTPKDDCDPENGRCGMSVKTDNLTGLQYLVTPKGGIYPRMDSDGHQVLESAK